HDKGIAALCPLDVNRAADRVDLRRAAVETGPQRRDRLVSRRLEVAGRGIVGLDLEGLARPHAQERLVPPVEGILAGLFAGDALHGSSWVRLQVDIARLSCGNRAPRFRRPVPARPHY